jgi:hypothetical protein
MAMVDADWTVDRSTGIIAYVGADHDGAASYATVIQWHRWLQALAAEQNAVPASSDEMDITNLNPSVRSTDNIITMINGYTITDHEIEHLYGGSIIMSDGDVIWDGITNFGNASVQIQLFKDGYVIADDWWNQAGAGVNPDATLGISHRFMIKTREDGVDIDGRRLRGYCRTLDDTNQNTYKEFPINGTARGENVLALDDKADINNTNTATAIEAWSAISNTEGLRLVDVDNDGTTEEYYNEWDGDIPTRTINEFYERQKWLTKAAIPEDSSTEIGTDYVVGNGTLTGQAQSFQNGVNATMVIKATVSLKKVLAPTGTLNVMIYAHSGTYGTSSIPTGAALATSDDYDVSLLTVGTYTDVTVNFSGANRITLSASTNYVVAVEYTGGDATNYVHVEGDATGTHSGNQSDETATVWTAAAAEDLEMAVYTTPIVAGLPGTEFRGITHSFAYDGETGAAWATNEERAYGTALVFDTQVGTFQVGEAIHEDTATPVWKARVLAYDDNNPTGTLIVDVEEGTITTGDNFTGQTSGATANTNGTPAVVVGGGVFRAFAVDDDGVVGNIYGQLIRGIAPVNDSRIYHLTDAAIYVDCNGAPTSRAIETPYCGVSTGSALIGSYGFTLITADLSKDDRITDLSGTINTPPNLVTNTISGLTFAGGADSDQVIVGPWDGSTLDANGEPAFDKGQLLVSTLLNADNITSVVVKDGTETAIPTDTPSDGYIRVIDDNGFERRLHYTAWDQATDTFTIDTTDGQEDFASVNASVNNQVWISYLDELATSATMSYQGVHGTNRNLVALVRNGGTSPIKQYLTSWTFLANAQTLNAIRNTDL